MASRLSKPVTNEAIPQDLQYLMNEMVANAAMTRTNLLEKLLDPRRDIDTECGYIDVYSMSREQFSLLHDTHPIANRVNSLLPKECWKTAPEVYEDEDNNKETPFEKSWKELCQNLRQKSKLKSAKYNPVWSVLAKADLISGIGHFGIILLGINDKKELKEPIDGFEDENNDEVFSVDILSKEGTEAQYNDYNSLPQDTTETDKEEIKPKEAPTEGLRLLFIRTFEEALVEITTWDSNTNSARYGQPLFYNVQLSDPKEGGIGINQPNNTVKVHWSRVIHIADNCKSSEVIGVPRCRPIMKPLQDLAKIYGGQAEGYWQVCLPGVILESEAGTDVDAEKTKAGVQNYIHRMQRWLSLSGMTAKTLQGTVQNPTPHLQANIDAICIQEAVPIRIFMGSERGELSSTQDKDSWEERLSERQENYITPNIVSPFIDRMIKIGILIEPESYSVNWDTVDNTSKTVKAQLALTITQALAAYQLGELYNLMDPVDYLVEVIGWPQTKVKQFLENTLDFMKKANPDMEGEPVPGKPPQIFQISPKLPDPIPDPNQIPPITKPVPANQPLKVKKVTK